MKLSQAILISLTLLICFSPILSMELSLLINQHENDLVQRLKDKHTEFFTNPNDHEIEFSYDIKKDFKQNKLGIILRSIAIISLITSFIFFLNNPSETSQILTIISFIFVFLSIIAHECLKNYVPIILYAKKNDLAGVKKALKYHWIFGMIMNATEKMH